MGDVLTGYAVDARQAFEAAGLTPSVVLDALPGLVIVIDRERHGLLSNARMQAYAGWAPSELEGLGWVRLIHKDDRDATLAAWHAAQETGDRFEVECRLRDGDGIFRWFLCRAGPGAPDGGQSREVWVIYCTEIEEQKRLEAALRDSEARVTRALEAGGVAEFEIDMVTDEVLAGPRAAALFGMAAPSPCKDDWFARVHPDDLPRIRQEMAVALEGDPSLRHDYRVIHPDGSVRWLHSRDEIERDAEGRPTRIVGCLMDVTDRVEAREAWRLASALTEGVGRFTPDLIFVKDREGRMVYANPAALAVFGRPAEAVIGKTDAEWHDSPEEIAAFSANDREVLETGRPVEREESFTGPDGERRHYLSSKSPWIDADGQVLGLVSLVKDITDRKAKEDARALLAREVDHRARNALAVVQSVLRLTKADTREDFVERVNGRINALARAHTLLAERKWEGADLKSVIEQELAAYAPGQSCDLSGPAVRLVPEAVQPVGMVVHELATNACKYGSLSRQDGRLHVRWSAGADGAVSIVWEEVGGPATVAPGKTGFGSTLLRQLCERQLGGSFVWDWRTEGLRACWTLPASALRG